MIPGLRAALAGGVAALLVGIFGFPQPFLAVIVSQLLVGQSGAAWPMIGRNLFWILTGVFLGGGCLVAVPQQPWIALPCAAILLGWGATLAAKKAGTVPLLLYLTGFVASFGNGWIHPGGFVSGAFAHGGSLAIALLSATLARSIFPVVELPGSGKRDIAQPGKSCWDFSFSGLSGMGLSVGVSCAAGLVLGGLVFPQSVVPMLIAVVTTCCGFWMVNFGSGLGQKIAGALVGGVVSVGFLIVIVGAGNNLAVFLGGLMVVLGGFEVLANRFGGRSAFFRQAAAVFAVAAPMFPKPVMYLDGILLRIGAVWSGFFLALGICAALRAVSVRTAREPARSGNTVPPSPSAG